MSDSNRGDARDQSGNPAETLREELVAYLDGELPPEVSRSLEQRVASDPEIRSELQGLDQAWNALDELPRTATDERFTRSTIEMITVTAEKELQQSSLQPIAVWKRPQLAQGLTQGLGRQWRLALACCAVFAGVFFVGSLGLLREERQLVTSLPIVANLDALGQIQEVGFLKQLATQNPDWLQTIEREAARSEADAATNRSASFLAASFLFESSRQQRRQWVQQQSPERKAELSSAHDRLRGLSEQQRQARQNVYQELQASPERERLAATLVAYQDWLSSLSAGQQAALRALPADKRLARIESLTKAKSRDRRRLSDIEARALKQALQQAAESPAVVRFREGILERMKQRRSQARGRSDRDRVTRFEQSITKNPAWSVLGLGRLALVGEMPAKVFLGSDWQAKQAAMLKEWERIEQTLLAALSREHRERLENDSSDRRFERLRAWIIEAMRESFEKQDLESFVESDAVSNDEFSRLLNEPTSEIQTEIRKLYVERELNTFDPLGGNFQRLGPSVRRGPERRGPERRGPGRGPERYERPETGRPDIDRSNVGRADAGRPGPRDRGQRFNRRFGEGRPGRPPARD